jgi:hypothetical protein
MVIPMGKTLVEPMVIPQVGTPPADLKATPVAMPLVETMVMLMVLP